MFQSNVLPPIESRASYKLYPIIKLAPGQALFLFSSRGLPPGTQTLAELHEADRDEDGFLYMFYAAQETFG